MLVNSFVVSKKISTKKSFSYRIWWLKNWNQGGNAYLNRLASVTNLGNAYVFYSDNGNIVSIQKKLLIK